MRYGLLVRGGHDAPRKLVDYAKAWHAFIECSDAMPAGECYLSAFQFGADLAAHMRSRQSERGFNGEHSATYLPFDIDRENLAEALDATRRIATCLVTFYQVTEDGLFIAFSGRKGFHILVPTCLVVAKPHVAFCKFVRRFAETVAAKAGTAIDSSIYTATRLFRAPNSRHAETGLYKRQLTYAELMAFGADRVREVAKAPAPVELADDVASNFEIAADWNTAIRSVTDELAARTERRAAVSNGTTEPHLNALTLAFIRDGADNGERATRLFSAAANLFEFGAAEALVEAILSPAALDCGLAPCEVSKQITGAARHSSRKAGNSV